MYLRLHAGVLLAVLDLDDDDDDDGDCHDGSGESETEDTKEPETFWDRVCSPETELTVGVKVCV